MPAPSRAPECVTDDLVHDPEDPPDEKLKTVAGPRLDSAFVKHVPRRTNIVRRESLLTKQLHGSGGESPTEDDLSSTYRPCTRARSNSSVADLTSDNDLTSPGTRGGTPSPPPPPFRPDSSLPILDKHVRTEPVILEQDETPFRSSDDVEKKLETGLGRRRCITFACGGKSTDKPKDTVKTTNNDPAPTATAEAPKRKPMISFNCPTRTKAVSPKQLGYEPLHIITGPKSPGLKAPLRSPKAIRHRGSDTTIRHASPVNLRKIHSFATKRRDKYVDPEDEDKLEAKRFHEFAVANGDEEWISESTCHRKRLTIKDTLQKENVIRQMGEEAEEEAEQDEDDLEDDAMLDEDDDEENEDEDELVVRNRPMAQAGDTISDVGFDTDDEEGFANSSDSEGGDSDFEWWAPGRSTAATSTDQLEHIRPSAHRRMSDSSLESAREANGSVLKSHKKSSSTTAAVKINRAPTPELPDSTDFVCGTLDEDRPLEQAYKACIEQRKAAKHRVTPQDIDPTFPTSDPEMDEEDEEEEVDNNDDDDDDAHLFMSGKMELEEQARRGPNKPAGFRRSPSPRRAQGVAVKGRSTHRSPPPPGRRSSLRSPPPPAARARLRSPPPRKLFGHSPKRDTSPPSNTRPSSPPNSRSSSIENTPKPKFPPRTVTTYGLGARPMAVSSSLPRVPTNTDMQNLPAHLQHANDEDDTPQRRIRGAIDIVKGLERKRQRRKEKLYQKHCQKIKKEGERKPKPGKGAERMRELGLELAAYRGKKAEHMLSI